MSGQSAQACHLISASILLLERSDTDVTLRDPEGYTAFDLYNSTIESTKPDSTTRAELFTWGVNRNAALGLGDGNDRNYPEQVLIQNRDTSEKSSIYARFLPVFVRQIQTSKLHTVVVTSEKKANVRVCGFGSGGRSGLSSWCPCPPADDGFPALALDSTPSTV